MSTAFTEQRIQSGALTSHVLTAGDPSSPALVLLHGAGPGASAASNWRHCIPDLAERFFVIAPDMTGFGATEYPDPLPNYALSWMGLRVEQVLGLLDTLGIEKAAGIVGNSMGGATALHILLEAPERFNKAMLMGAIGAPFTRTPELVRMLSFYQDPRLGRYRELIHSFVADPSAVPDLEETVLERFRTAMEPSVRAVQDNAFEVMKSGMDTIILPPSVLARLPHEVSIVHGRQDRIVPLETSLYFLEHLKNAELHVLDRCGHWAQTQRWDAMLPLINDHF